MVLGGHQIQPHILLSHNIYHLSGCGFSVDCDDGFDYGIFVGCDEGFCYVCDDDHDYVDYVLLYAIDTTKLNGETDKYPCITKMRYIFGHDNNS